MRAKNRANIPNQLSLRHFNFREMDDDENRSSNLRRTYSAPILNVDDYPHGNDKFFDAFDGRRASSSSGQAGFYSLGSNDATQESLRVGRLILSFHLLYINSYIL